MIFMEVMNELFQSNWDNSELWVVLLGLSRSDGSIYH